jgi:hypothetical protein
LFHHVHENFPFRSGREILNQEAGGALRPLEPMATGTTANVNDPSGKITYSLVVVNCFAADRRASGPLKTGRTLPEKKCRSAFFRIFSFSRLVATNSGSKGLCQIRFWWKLINDPMHSKATEIAHGIKMSLRKFLLRVMYVNYLTPQIYR